MYPKPNNPISDPLNMNVSLDMFFLNLYLCLQKRAVQNSKSYHEGLQALTVLSDPHDILQENEGKLVHVAGYLTMYDPMEDLPYGVSIYAVKLKRRVQMYQWVEEKNG
jgi:hypothetical protein